MSNKRWCITFFVLLFFSLLAIIPLVIIIDPFFHYHKPLKNLFYSLNQEDESYINDGIAKMFDYDAVITGTSMTENFKPSEANSLFRIKSIKLPLSGSPYKTINEQLERVLSYNPKVKYVFRGLDLGFFQIFEWNVPSYLPSYLYDKNFINDFHYIYNKDVLLKKCIPMIRDKLFYKKEGGITDFDNYSYWSDSKPTGKAYALKGISHFELKKGEMHSISKNTETAIVKNITENVISLAKDYPNITFYFFLTPYSAVWWGQIYSNIENFIEQEKIVIELILNCENIKLYSFNSEFEITTNLNYYTDNCHYEGKVSSYILKYMKEDRDLLTKDNYLEYLNKEKEFYLNFDYNSLFEQ